MITCTYSEKDGRPASCQLAYVDNEGDFGTYVVSTELAKKMTAKIRASMEIK